MKCDKCNTEMNIYKGQEVPEGYRVIYKCRNSQCPEFDKDVEVIKRYKGTQS